MCATYQQFLVDTLRQYRLTQHDVIGIIEMYGFRISRTYHRRLQVCHHSGGFPFGHGFFLRSLYHTIFYKYRYENKNENILSLFSCLCYSPALEHGISLCHVIFIVPCHVPTEYLKLWICLQNGLASHDTFQRVFALLAPEELERSFERWTQSVHVKTKGEIVSIDGKTVRGSRDKAHPIVHMVSAWADENQLVLGQVRTEAKSNEITAIPTLLALLDLQGCIVTIDAMGCQKEIAKAITAKEADYVLSLKENHPDLFDDVRTYFQDEENALQSHKTHEKDHGRIEMRKYYLSADIDWLPAKPQWAGLNGIGMVCSDIQTGGKTTRETRYFITSLSDVKDFARAVRSHWGIENSVHWCLDVIFHEDANRTRKNNSGENFSVIRRVALNLLRLNPSKMSLRCKRFRCQIDTDFLADVLFLPL